MDKIGRRRVLTTIGVTSLTTLAGCSGSGGADTETTDGASTSTRTGTPDASTPTGTASGVPTEQTAKLASGDAGDRFGSWVTVAGDGSTAIIGAPGDAAPNGEKTGTAYVFSRTDGTWSQQTRLVPDDGDSQDKFGFRTTVSDDGSTAIIGAPEDDDPNGEGAGAAYVFSQADGTWSQEAKLAADDGDSKDGFGGMVAVSGDGSTAIVGAFFDEDPNGSWAGSAYVFSRAGGTWSQQAKLAPDDGDDDDLFGGPAVSADGSTAIIGAGGEEDPNGEGAGAAYVFSRSEDTWSQQRKLAPDDGDSDDSFGIGVTVSDDGSTAIIGAPGDEDSNGEGAGAAYVFSQADGTWSQQTKLAADDGDSEDSFGIGVTVSDDGSIAIIGAPGDEDPNGEGAGAAYVFSQVDGTWNQQAKLVAEDGDAEDGFSFPVAVSGDGSTAIIGASRDEDPNGEQAGAAYVFE